MKQKEFSQVKEHSILQRIQSIPETSMNTLLKSTVTSRLIASDRKLSSDLQDIRDVWNIYVD